MDTNLLNQLLTQIVAQKATEGLSSSTLIFIIAALMPTLAAIAAYLKAAAAAAGTKEISVKVDGKLEEFLRVARSQGKDAGRQEVHQETLNTLAAPLTRSDLAELIKAREFEFVNPTTTPTTTTTISLPLEARFCFCRTDVS